MRSEKKKNYINLINNIKIILFNQYFVNLI